MTQHAGCVSDARRLVGKADRDGLFGVPVTGLTWSGPGTALFTDYAVRSQPILIIVLMQSSGKYNFQSRTFSAERVLSISFVRLAISVAFSEGCTCGTAKIGTRGEASKFIFLLRACCENAIPTGIAPCGLFAKPPMQKDTGEQ